MQHHELIKPPEPGDMISIDYYRDLHFGVLLKNYLLYDGHPCIRYLPLTVFTRSGLLQPNDTAFSVRLRGNIQAKYSDENYEYSVRAYGKNLPRRLCKISLDSVNAGNLDLELLTSVMNNIQREYQNNRPVNAV